MSENIQPAESRTRDKIKDPILSGRDQVFGIQNNALHRQRMSNKFLYIFFDESGNFDFSDKGTKYFLLTSITKERPFEAFKALHNLRYDLAEEGCVWSLFMPQKIGSPSEIGYSELFNFIFRASRSIRLLSKSKKLPQIFEL